MHSAGLHPSLRKDKMSLEEELKEGAEHAHQSGEKGIGLTMAIVAVLLAIATLMGHRAHTEEGLIQGKIVDEWNFYQAKHIRAHEYGAIAEVAALLPNGKDLALKDYKRSLDEECGTPAEDGCSSPARNSALLSPLLAPAESAAGTNKNTNHGTAVKDDAAKHHDKEVNSAKEQRESKSPSHRPGAMNIQESAKEMERERDLVERRANYYDGAELFLEISIVLCSIALLAEAKLFWQLSFITTILGIGVALFGFLVVH
jgi:hypothetical protein